MVLTIIFAGTRSTYASLVYFSCPWCFLRIPSTFRVLCIFVYLVHVSCPLAEVPNAKVVPAKDGQGNFFFYGPGLHHIADPFISLENVILFL